ncbi:MAG TPA: MCP four helix bundle domain-containing protein, partial [Gallionella sp.]|nr:MCP four helix bundle domain-containing protein [Gallionella sp.]
MNNLTLKAKLFGLLGVSLLALLIVGAIGWIGLVNTAASVNEIGKVRLPSVLGLEIVNEGQTALRSNIRRVAQFQGDYQAQEQFAAALKEDAEIWKRVEDGWKMYEPLPQTPEEAVLWTQFVKEWDEWKAANMETLQVVAALSKNTDANRQNELFASYKMQVDAARPLYAKAESTLNKIVELNVRVSDEAVVAGENAVGNAKTMMLGGAAIMLAALSLLGIWIMRSILAQLGGEPAYVADVVKRVAEGDLTVRVQTGANDTSSMLFAIRGMTEKLSGIIGEVRGAADALSSASEEVSATAQSMSQATSEQAASVEETSASVEQMSASI